MIGIKELQNIPEAGKELSKVTEWTEYQGGIACVLKVHAYHIVSGQKMHAATCAL